MFNFFAGSRGCRCLFVQFFAGSRGCRCLFVQFFAGSRGCRCLFVQFFAGSRGCQCLLVRLSSTRLCFRVLRVFLRLSSTPPLRIVPQLRIVSIFHAIILDGPNFFYLDPFQWPTLCSSDRLYVLVSFRSSGAPSVWTIFDTCFSLFFDLPSVLCEYLVKEFPESRTHVAVLCPP